MSKMAMDIGKSLEYAFSEKDWVKKLGVTFLAFFVVYGISRVISLVINFSSIFFMEGGELADEYLIPYLASYSVALFAAVLSIPLTVYFYGYKMQIFENVKKGVDELPMHDNLQNKFLNGLKYWVIELIYSLVPGLLFTISLVLLIIGIVLITGGITAILGIVLTIVGGLFTLITFLLLIAVGLLVKPAAVYLFLKNKQIKDALKIKEVFEVVKSSWKDLLLAAVYNFLALFVINIASMVLFCIAFIVQPFIQAYTVYFEGHLYGQVYAELEKNNI